MDQSTASAWIRRNAPAVAGLFLALIAAPLAAEPANPAIEEIRREISRLRLEYGERLAALERRLAALETATEAPQPPPRDTEASGELERLRAAAREAAGEPVAEDLSPGPSRAAEAPVGRERNLNRLNPEISFTGIFVGTGGDAAREEFRLQEFELDLQSNLDPFSRARLTVSLGEEEPEIEEGYVLYTSLPGSLELTAGRFRQRFGALNRQHLHALPQSEYPLALTTFFGEEGLAQTGVSLTWLLPRSWATASEATLELTDGDNETAFAGEDFEDLAVLGRLKSFWQLGDAAYFEWGLSGIAGETATGGDSRVWGTDLTYSWRPPSRAKYREILWRTEMLLAQRDEAAGREREAWGGYTYLEGLLRRNLWAGFRLDRVEDLADPSRYSWAFSPYMTWWQSEYVRLRAEYGRLTEEPDGVTADRFTLQLTWAAGPHKHETY